MEETFLGDVCVNPVAFGSLYRTVGSNIALGRGESHGGHQGKGTEWFLGAWTVSTTGICVRKRNDAA